MSGNGPMTTNDDESVKDPFITKLTPVVYRLTR
jgi:hypothetical protein